MENLFEELLDACRKANCQKIEKLLRQIQIDNPQAYNDAQKKVREHLELAKRQDREDIEKEIQKSIDEMNFMGLIEIAISMLAVIPEENEDQNDKKNI